MDIKLFLVIVVEFGLKIENLSVLDGNFGKNLNTLILNPWNLPTSM